MAPKPARCRMRDHAGDGGAVCDDPGALKGIRHDGHHHWPGSIAGKSPRPACSGRFRADAPAALAAGPAADVDRVLTTCRRHGQAERTAGNPAACARRAVWPGQSPRPRAARAAGPPGAKAPGQSLPCPRRALACRWSRTRRSTGHRPARAGETRVAFPVPARDGRKHLHRCNGRGHRPCHSATLPLVQPGAQSPRPAPAPPSAGALHPPGRALAFRGARTCRSTGDRPAGAGETRCVSPARTGKSTITASMAGAIAPATAPCCSLTSRRPKPMAGASPPPGRALVSMILADPVV